MSSLTIAIFVVLTILMGAAFPFQAGINAIIGKHLAAPLYGGITNTIVASLTFLIAILIVRPGMPNLKAFSEAPWWAWTGGLLGASFVFGSLYIAPKLGAASFVSASIAGTVLASLLVDHFGLLGYPVSEISMIRLLGVALVLGGMMIIQFAR